MIGDLDIYDDEDRAIIEASKFLIAWQDGSYSDWTNYIDFSSLEIGARCDETFASGSCRAFNDWQDNIPPYTTAYILGKWYLIQSERTKYQTQSNLYVHNITITELTAILECLILGSKAFTNWYKDSSHHSRDDRYKVRFVIPNMMNAKYGGSILQVLDYPSDPVYTELGNQNNDYTFGAGTTVYAALTEILKRVNARPVVSYMEWYNRELPFEIDFKPFKLDGEVVYNLVQSRITQATELQSQENYCKFLETEAHNVVDRTNTHKDTNLTLRSPAGQRFIWDENDTLRLHTNAKIDYVEHFYATGIITQFVCTRLAGRDFLGNSYSPTLNVTTWDYTLPTDPIKMYQFIDQIPNAATKQRFVDALEAYCAMYHIDYDKMINAGIKIEAYGNEPTYTYGNASSGIIYTDKFFVMTTGNLGTSINPYIDTKIDLTNYVLEKSQYDAEETNVQCKYAYYTKGSNEIGGVYKKINQSFWDNIFSYLTGSIEGPMLSVAQAEWDSQPLDERRINATAYLSNKVFHIGDVYSADEGNLINPATKGPYYSYTDDENTKAAKFEIQYAAITDPMMVDTKTGLATNEPEFKPISRSYNNSASLIDFDKMVSSMAQINSWIGRPDMTIEYDITGLDNLPELTNKINGMYLMSYTIKYYMSHVLMTLNLCKNYSKIAEAIGVAYQYHATNFATDEIIERPIYRKWTLSSANINLLGTDNCFLWFQFKTSNVGQSDILVKPIVMKQNGKILLYCEALDQFAWGIKKTTYTANSQNYDVGEYVAYANENNEISGSGFHVKLVQLVNPLTADESYLLPMQPYAFTVPTDATEVANKYTILADLSLNWVYKDQREKLTFTFEIEEEE